MVGKNFVPTTKYNAEKANTKTQQEALNALQAEYDAFKESKMTDDEKVKEQAKKMQEQYQKANLTISKMYAENTFAKAGIKEDDYKEILGNIVTEDPEKTKGLAEIICNAMLKQKSDVEKSFKEKITKGTPTPPAGNDNDSGKDSKIENIRKMFDEAQKRQDFAKMAYYTRLMQEAQRNEE